jgi:adenosylcobinamide-phosphate synthase
VRMRARAEGSATRGMVTADAVGLLAGYALDAVFGDPRRFHPVAGYGTAAAALERRLYAPNRRSGAAFTAVAVGAPLLAGLAASRLSRRRPATRAALVAVTTWTVLGGRTLRHEATTMAGHLERADLGAARGRLNHLCGRDPSALDEQELGRATVESVAENTSDAVVAPLVWGALAGLPGLLAYRVANTLDAMVGHRSPRYARFGTPAARLDDLLNLLPSRLTGLLTIAVAPVAGGRRAEALRVWRRDRNDHPSPNAGQCESAMAGALGVRLGGRNVYFGRSETRPFLGDGPKPTAGHLRRAAKLCGAVGLSAVTLAAAGALARSALTRAVVTRAPSAPRRQATGSWLKVAPIGAKYSQDRKLRAGRAGLGGGR